ncbi:hypothetical protein [Bradyrhizobium sp. 188]|uniref:hypothetical protein n=1 Tax=Bradyrhizobium sp. 188 TaxID=2782656 RepID=UPI001FF7098F|nr:hypothetical protein [Bradyrhizobium sp. 188]MCK1501506.1 hypothetical protein [Bradyrhizobium sp. 188]
MTIFTDGLRLESPDRPVTDYDASFGAQLGATAAEALSDSPTAQLLGIAELDRARGIDYGRFSGVDDAATFGGPQEPVQGPSIPTLTRAAAEDRVKQAGLESHLTVPAGETIPAPVLDIMLTRARERAEREATIARGPQNIFAAGAGLGTSFLVGAIDPINIGASLIPVMGEMRYGKLLASAGESAITRAGVRAGVGAAQGVVGQAALEPLDWYSHTQEGRDFGMSDVLHNLVFGAALGGVLHSGGGAIADVMRRRRGEAVYPFGPGEPLEGVSGTHVSAASLDQGLTVGELPDHLVPVVDEIDRLQAASSTPPAVKILQDLPPRAQEDSMRAALAAIVSGEPVKVGEMLEAAAKSDPRIAQSFEAFHGTPHEFDRFDSSKIGAGEGAQSYGHGLYFAEKDEVARGYQRRVSDKAFVNKVAELYDEGYSPPDAWAEIRQHWTDFSPGEQRLMLALEKDDWFGFDYPHQAVNAALRDPSSFDPSPETVAAVKAIGNLYRVKISADKDHMLDWDRSFEAQSSFVRAALLKLGFNEADVAGAPGKEFHTWLAKEARSEIEASGREVGPGDTRRQAAAKLAEVGIPGIKYLDRGSRSGGEHTQNFVVFDDKHIEITHKNGEPVARPEPRQMETLVTINGETSRVNYGQHDAAPPSADDWRDLMRHADEVDHPDVLEASRAADETPEVKTRLDDRVAAAEKADADSADLYKMVSESLPEAERQRLDDALKAIEEDHQLQSEIIERSGACLFGARG